MASCAPLARQTPRLRARDAGHGHPAVRSGYLGGGARTDQGSRSVWHHMLRERPSCVSECQFPSCSPSAVVTKHAEDWNCKRQTLESRRGPATAARSA